MAIHFACACGHGFSVRRRRAGKTGTCPNCGQAITVPRLAASDSPSSPAAAAMRAAFGSLLRFPRRGGADDGENEPDFHA